jgi:DNA-binding transcriptional ArsR family regulator
MEGHMVREDYRQAVLRTDDALDRYAAIFGALSEPVRLDILLRIAERPELACTILDDTLRISKSTISYHIKILYQAGLIEVRKDGRGFFYRVREDYVEACAPRLIQQMLAARPAKQSGRSRQKRVLAAV